MNKFLKSEKFFVYLCSSYLVFILLIPLFTSPENIKLALYEEGIIEVVICAALLIAAFQLAFSRLRTRAKWPLTFLFIIMAIKETNIQKMFSITEKSSGPLVGKIIVYTIELVFICLLIDCAILVFRFLTQKSQQHTFNWRCTFLAAALLPISKLLHYLPDILIANFGYAAVSYPVIYSSMLAEGLEFLSAGMVTWILYANIDEFYSAERYQIR